MEPISIIATLIEIAIIIAVFILPPILIIRGIVALIKKILKKNQKQDLTQSKDWLTRAQARQEIRFQNSLPPLLSKQKPLQKAWSMRRNEKKGKSAMDWIYNEETELWEPPKHLKK